MEHGVDTFRLIDFPVVASGQLPQSFQEWLGEANDLCPLLLTWFKRRLANRFPKRVYLPRLNQNAFYQKIIEIKSAIKGI